MRSNLYYYDEICVCVCVCVCLFEDHDQEVYSRDQIFCIDWNSGLIINNVRQESLWRSG